MICDPHLIRECVLLLLRVVQVGVGGERMGRQADALNNGDHGKSMVIVGYLAVVL